MYRAARLIVVLLTACLGFGPARHGNVCLGDEGHIAAADVRQTGGAPARLSEQAAAARIASAPLAPGASTPLVATDSISIAGPAAHGRPASADRVASAHVFHRGPASGRAPPRFL